MWGQGRGYFRGRRRGTIWQRWEGGDSLHSLKPEWDLSMLYGLVHASVWQREFESFTEQLLPLGIAVKVKVLQTHTQISA